MSTNKYWYTQKVTKKTWPGQVENEVFISKKHQDTSFFGGENRQETLDQLIGVFRRNIGEYNFNE